MTYVGIDPGQQGGIAIISDGAAEAYRYTSTKLIEILRTIKQNNEVAAVYVEEVHAMPGQGVVSMFTFGTGFGQIIGILEALDFPINLVKPQVWKRALNVTADKNSSIRKAQYLYPKVSLLPTPRCRVPSDGLAEALLIAEYGRLQHVRKNYFKESW